MTVSSENYQLVSVAFPGEASNLSRKEARANYKLLMEQKPVRLKALENLLAENGVVLSSDDEGIQGLNDFFCSNVCEDPTRARAILPEWISVSFDVSLFIGETIIERFPHLRWEMHTGGKKEDGYQSPVLSGFTRGKIKNFQKVIFGPVLGYAYQIANQSNGPEIVVIRGEPLEFTMPPVETAFFVRLAHSSDERA